MYLRRRAEAYLTCTNAAGPGCHIASLSQCDNDFLCDQHPVIEHYKLIAEELVRCADVIAKWRGVKSGAV
jgi:hypothetical protein